MSFAAVRSHGLRSLVYSACFVALGWSGVVTAQPAATATPPKAGTVPVGNPSTAPAGKPAGTPASTSGSNGRPSAAAARAPEAATKSAPSPVASGTASSASTASAVPTTQAAAPPPAAATGSPGAAAPSDTTGEPWLRSAPAGAPNGTSSAATTSPWPETNAGVVSGAPGAPVYYVEQPPNPNGQPGAAGATRPAVPPPDPEMDPIRLPIDEPPPPPIPRHVAPRTALWLGARVGLFVPFGDLWGRCAYSAYGGCDSIEGARFTDVASIGPMFELDAGIRLARHYVIYFGWERSQLGSADGPSPDPSIAGKQTRAESDFWALGVRLSSDPDKLGLVLDLAIGARRFQGFYHGASDGAQTKLQLTDAPMESRLGLGADIRINRMFSLSPLFTIGLGSFGKADWVRGDTIMTAIPSSSDRLTHGWLTLQLGGHFDLLAAR